jgi:NAD(P)-dependent dehydrogenase (short-subunit alcohol dehydrogenase family)
MNDVSFEGQVAIVTGGGRGLGRSYAIGLARRGASVVVNDIATDPLTSLSRAEEVVREITELGGRAVASFDSVQSPTGGKAIVEQAVTTFGSVDIVVNNAGFLRSAYFDELTEPQLEEVMSVHLLGAFHVTRPAWTIMREKEYGRVVFTSSSSSFGQQANSNYAAAKAGILGLTASLAVEGEPHGIRVNAVLPFAVSPIAVDNPLIGADTARIRAALDSMSDRRAPESVAPLVLFLASRRCPVTGHAYSALAGRYARVFFGVTGGWLNEEGAEVSPEDIGDHIREMDDLSRFDAPASMLEEIESVVGRLQAIRPPS